MRCCEQCEEPISEGRLKLVPNTRLCVECQSEDDVFKFKMKTVGFDETPTMARNKKDWAILKKQKAVKDI